MLLLLFLGLSAYVLSVGVRVRKLERIVAERPTPVEPLS